MYGNKVAERFGIFGLTLQHEVNYICFDKFIEQEAKINAAVKVRTDAELSGLKKFTEQSPLVDSRGKVYTR